MNDLTITQLCFEAISGIKTPRWGLQLFQIEGVTYDPLHDDAQAMALVKRFKLELYWVGSENYGDEFDTDDWMVAQSTVKLSNCGNDVRNADLNRAICECVANMQQAKG
jgi:hypothetical protein